VKAPGGGPFCEQAVSTLADLVECLACTTEFEVDCVDRSRVPAFDPYPCECRALELPLPAPATVSNLRQSLIQVSDPICDVPGLVARSSFLIELDYDDPDGDVTAADTIVTESFRFVPNGTVGAFETGPSAVLGDGFSGTVQYIACTSFGTNTGVERTVTIRDAGGRRSNALTVTSPKPPGGN
jgi:hypothetical protein